MISLPWWARLPFASDRHGHDRACSLAECQRQMAHGMAIARRNHPGHDAAGNRSLDSGRAVRPLPADVPGGK